MEIHRSLGVSRLVAFLAAHRASAAHDRLLARLDRSIAEARELCERARGLSPDEPDGETAVALQVVLARPTRNWVRRAETVVATVRTGGDTICGARAAELRRLIDTANVALLRRSESQAPWRDFCRSALGTRL